MQAFDLEDLRTGERSAITAIAARIGVEVLARHADDVDRRARFPEEALGALRDERLLSAYVPAALGGFGCHVGQLCAATETLARHCAATGMIFAMHQIQVACLVHHGASAWFRDYLESVCRGQSLLASVTSEMGVGGDLRRSIAHVDGAGPHSVRKSAPTASYAEHADALLLTARRNAEAAPADQVLVLLRRDQVELERTGSWDALGMRGTCSPSFEVSAKFGSEQVLGDFASIANHTMVPFSHLLWASCWLGIAVDAVAKARRFVRGEARKKPGVVPPSALRLAEVSNLLELLRARVLSAQAEYGSLLASQDVGEVLSSVGYAIRINELKLAASELVVEIVTRALRICGMAAYKNDSPFSLGRQLRDAHSAALMIGNDRICASNASLLLVHKDD
jgi:acyl-CoA dehydrogenase